MFFSKPATVALVLGLTASQASWSADGTTEAPRGNWTESSAGPVRLISSMPEERAVEALDQLHQLLELLEPFTASSANEIVILTFDQHRSFSRYAPFEDVRGIGGWHQRDGSTSYLGVDGSLRASWRQTMLHETVHAILSHRSQALPLWLEEGVAEFFSTLEQRRDRVAIGLPIEHHLQLLRSRQRWLPWREVFEMTSDSPSYDARLEGQLFYAQSWLLIHYLMVDPERSTQLHRLLENPGTSPPKPDDLGLDPERLEVVLRRWTWSPQLPYLRLPKPRGTEDTVGRTELSEAALLARLGHLLASRSRGTATLARKHFEAALQIDPGERMALDGMTRLRATTGPHD